MRKSILLLSLAMVACAPKPAVDGATASATGLAGTDWRLIEIQSMDDAQGVTRVATPDSYIISFAPDGQVAVKLDCNRGTGRWQSDGTATLRVGPLATTKALCPPPSLGERLAVQLDGVRSYLVEDGRFNMSLMADAGILVWERIRAAD